MIVWAYQVFTHRCIAADVRAKLHECISNQSREFHIEAQRLIRPPWCVCVETVLLSEVSEHI